jgi:hypothetical protein
MSAVGAAIRNADGIRAALAAVQKELASFSERARAESPKELPGLFLLRDMLISQFVYLSAFDDYIKSGGKSRGSALYTDPDGKKPHAGLPDLCTFTLDDGSRGGLVQEVSYRDGACTFTWRPVRPIPAEDDLFENVWRAFREHGNVY